MKTRSLLAAFAFTATALTGFAAAASDYVTGTLGWYDATQQDNTATEFGLEYRLSPINYGIRPIIGAFGTTDGSAYGYAGLQWDITLMPNQLYLSPNFAAGAYHHGDGKNLGGVVEFRSGIELAYQMPNQHRIGAAFNHISNASIYNHNPGVETALVSYSIPTSAF